MEVIGAIASTYALLEAGKRLKECVEKFPTHRRRLLDTIISINLDLESLHDLAHNHYQSEVDAPQLRDAVSSLEADLQSALGRCQRMSKSISKYSWLKFAIWKDSDNVELELLRVEQRVANCCRRFSVSGIARVEMSLVEMTGMTDQLRAEISHRLDSVEDHLRARVVVAEADSAEAEALVGIHEMSPPALESALVRATAELSLYSPTALESRYLHVKVEALTNAVRSLPAEEIASRPSSLSSSNSGSHMPPTDDPLEQIEDVIMEATRILRTLRKRDRAAPVTQIAAELENLATELIDLGMYMDAHEAYLQVVRICRGFEACDSSPPIIDVRLGRALCGISVSLQRLGRSREGLNPAREAESIFRSLEHAHPGRYRRELALILTNMSCHLRHSGMYSDAMTAANETVEHRRRLILDIPESQVHKAELATALLNASTCCSKIPQMTFQASSNAWESVTITRELAAIEPAVYVQYLGASLHNAAILQPDRDAYTTMQEALKIRRNLAMSRPKVFGGGLKRSLLIGRYLAHRCGDFQGAEELHEELRTYKSKTEATVNQGSDSEDRLLVSNPYGLMPWPHQVSPTKCLAPFPDATITHDTHAVLQLSQERDREPTLTKSLTESQVIEQRFSSPDPDESDSILRPVPRSWVHDFPGVISSIYLNRSASRTDSYGTGISSANTALLAVMSPAPMDIC